LHGYHIPVTGVWYAVFITNSGPIGFHLSGLVRDYNDGQERVILPAADPGQSDEIEFVLQAAIPGRAMLMGTVGYEMHDLEYSWASWSGCNAEPLEITITL